MRNEENKINEVRMRNDIRLILLLDKITIRSYLNIKKPFFIH